MDGYRKFLEKSEEVRLVVKRDFPYCLQKMLLYVGWIPLLICIGGTIAFFAVDFSLWLWLGILGFALLVLLCIVYATVREWNNTRYVVTDRRVYRCRAGKIYELRYDQIKSIRVQICPWNDDKGSVRFKGKDVKKLNQFNNIEEVDRVADIIAKARDDLHAYPIKLDKDRE